MDKQRQNGLLDNTSFTSQPAPATRWEEAADVSNPEDEEFFLLAIQTVLHNQKSRIHLFLDSARCQSYIREMSEEILRRANRYKKLSGSAMRDVENQPPY